jgi:pilus assembly protein CpaE
MINPLKAVVVGLDQHYYAQVARVLEACSINASARFPDARSAVDGTRLSQGEMVLCLMHVASEEHLAQIKYLRETFVGRPLLALVEGDSEAELLFAISQVAGGPVLRLPLEAEEVKVALRCVKAGHGPPLPVSSRRVIAVSGVAGGCGATSIAVNLAYEIATQFELSCVLMDFACGGIVSVCLDVDAKYTLSDLVGDMRSADVQQVEKMLLPITDRLRVFPAPPIEDEPLRASPEDIVQVLDLVKQLADVVVLDLPLHNDVRFEAFSGVNQVLLVAEQSVPSMRALGNARKVLDPIQGLRHTMVINRFNPRLNDFTIPHLQRLMKTTQLITITNDYAAVSGSINEGRPIRIRTPSSRVVADIHNLARMQVSTGQQPQPQPQQVKKSSGFNWLLNALTAP